MLERDRPRAVGEHETSSSPGPFSSSASGQRTIENASPAVNGQGSDAPGATAPNAPDRAGNSTTSRAEGSGTVVTGQLPRLAVVDDKPDSVAETGRVQRDTRAPDRSAHPPSWLTFVGWGSGGPHRRCPKLVERGPVCGEAGPSEAAHTSRQALHLIPETAPQASHHLRHRPSGLP